MKENSLVGVICTLAAISLLIIFKDVSEVVACLLHAALLYLFPSVSVVEFAAVDDAAANSALLYLLYRM